MKNTKIFLSVVIMVIAALSTSIYLRVEKHPLNFAPLIAIALFSTAYLPKRWMGIALSFFCWIVSDIVVNATDGWAGNDGAGYFVSITAIGVYTGLILVLLFAGVLRKGVKIPKLLGVTIGSSVIFFFVTNSFCFFIGDDLYGPGIVGYFKCLAAGIPFYRNSILGDLFYVTIFFGLYYLVNRRSLKPAFV